MSTMKPEDEIDILKTAIKNARSKLFDIERWIDIVKDGKYGDDYYKLYLGAKNALNSLNAVQHSLQTALFDTTF